MNVLIIIAICLLVFITVDVIVEDIRLRREEQRRLIAMKRKYLRDKTHIDGSDQ